MTVVRDVLRSLTAQGFKRILILNGHRQNEMAKYVIEDLAVENPDLNVEFRSWHVLPRTHESIEAEGPESADSIAQGWCAGLSTCSSIGFGGHQRVGEMVRGLARCLGADLDQRRLPSCLQWAGWTLQLPDRRPFGALRSANRPARRP